jgi:ABC-type phosphate/phosphonate transport system substrate-binding protein
MIRLRGDYPRNPGKAHSEPAGKQPGDRIARGEADATAVDCMTFAFRRRHRPAAAARVRRLADTPPSPAIPYVTSAATPAPVVEILRGALRRLLA